MSIPLPIPSAFKCDYFFLPYRVADKIFKFHLTVKMTDTMMDVKCKIAQHAREFYKQPISPYEFIMAQIDNRDFSLCQIFTDDVSTNVLEISYQQNFIFAYQINPAALNPDAIPPLTDTELKQAQPGPIDKKIESDDEN